MLKLYGFSIIDADLISHEVLDLNAKLIKDEFGDEFVNENKVDRKRLGKLVFNDTLALQKLENILHPKIRAKIYEKASKLEELNLPYFVDIPLFFEKGGYEFKNVLLVYASKDLLIKRIMKRDNLEFSEAQNRVNLQLDPQEKLNLANFVVRNESDLKSLNSQIDDFIGKLRQKYTNLKI